ncbi:hypothetical protein EX895_002539 [Sporisorium graminicola]|uniref:Uncharacterized protein n=1 Tax=Sporisorium graminicola TaxID=280036 RepID=A0A4U7KVL2_9BASI|nr:hypothetical protein EX895_002539 [Sporisorium graminicola]TKY88550.1 hypothetical protein EX895_002539 [Sporisorium graminicola]
MSIRFHKGPSIITLFHDASSSTSKQVLQLLSSYNSNPHHPTPSQASTSSSGTGGSHGESCVIEANGAGADANAYLRQAASDPPRSPLIQLEVVDRRANPPTPDQLRSIVDYLAADTDPDAASKKEANYTSSGFDLNEHQRRKKALAQHLSAEEGKGISGMPKIKDGPLVVNWDEGTAATSLDGVRQMLHRLESTRKEDKSGKDDSSCVVC